LTVGQKRHNINQIGLADQLNAESGKLGKMPKLTIGQVATEGGVNVETIRYYQRRGLLEEPEKPVGGYRNYPKEIVKRIRFIKRAQALGFSLEEVAELLQLDLADGCAKSCDLADQSWQYSTSKLQN
jgi:MerR family transcriptional regulator, mercuric resistance operon regulatory protein